MGLWCATAELQHAVRGIDLTLGEFTARPVLGGIAYSKRGSRIEVTAIMTAGISFSKLELSEVGRLGIRAASGVVDERATSKVVLAVQPKLTLWVDLNRWLAVGGNASYVWQRPKITLTNAAGTVEEFTVNAGHGPFQRGPGRACVLKEARAWTNSSW